MIKNDHTFVIIPDGTKEPRRVFLSKKFLNIILYVTLVLLGAGFVRLFVYAKELVELRRVAGPILVENRDLHQRNKALISQRNAIQFSKDSILNEIETERVAHAKRLAEVTDELERLENFVTDLKILAGYKLSKEDAEKLKGQNTGQSGQDGQGGPDISPDAYLEGLTTKPTKDTLKSSIDSQAESLADRLRDKRDALKDLRNFLERKATLLEGRPIGWPMVGVVTSEFGPRNGEFHPGFDIANVIGTPIFATGDGVVTFRGYVGTYGNMIEVDHGKGFTTLYAHLSRYAIALGDRIERGDLIGYSGNTGRTTGPHLHYEVHVNGVPVNPRPYLEKTAE